MNFLVRKFDILSNLMIKQVNIIDDTYQHCVSSDMKH